MRRAPFDETAVDFLKSLDTPCYKIASFENADLPLHGGRQAIWHLAEVLDWLEQRGNYPISPSILETAAMTQALNLARVRWQPQHGQEQRPSPMPLS